MPRDKNGKPLKIGDPVIIRATVRDIRADGDYCNVALETNESMYADDLATYISLNGRQVEAVADGAAAAPENGC